MEPIEHGAHRFRAHKGHIAIEHQHIAIEACELALGLLDGMGGAELRVLQTGARRVAERLFELFAARADHHHLPRRCERIDARHQMMEHRPTGDRVEHLVHIALHAGALARGEDDGSKFVFLVHA